MDFLVITDPSDWPSSMPELRTIDTLLRCGICYEFFNIAMMIPQCSHNYCSMCIRRFMNYKKQCPTCNTPAEASELRNNRSLDQLVTNFKAVRPQILKLCKENEAQKDGKAAPPEPTCTTPKQQQPRTTGKRKAKSSPFLKQPAPDSDDEDMEDFRLMAPSETPKWKGLRKVTSPPAATSVQPTSTEMNRSNEENIDPTYEPPDKGGDSDDSDYVPMATPSKPSTSRNNPGVTSSAKKAATPATRSEKVDCPVCGVPIASKHVNTHLDACLTRSEEKTKRARAPTRKPLPKIVTSVMSDKELRKKLREHGLNTQGHRSVLSKRLHDFTLMYNAQCDSSSPMPVEAIVKEFNKTEKLKAQQPTTSHDDQRLKVSRSQSETEIEKSQQDYLKSHGGQFQTLIKNARERMRNKAKKATDEATEGQPDPQLPSINTASTSSSSEPETSDEASPHPEGEGDRRTAETNIESGNSDESAEDVAEVGEATDDETVINNVYDESTDIECSGEASSSTADKKDAVVSRKQDATKPEPLILLSSNAKNTEDLMVNGEDDVTVSVATATKRREESEEQMDMSEDEFSPVFGKCSAGSSSSSSRAAVDGAARKNERHFDISAKENTEGTPSQAALTNSVPSPPSLLHLNDMDNFSEGSSLATFETFSETSGSHGDVPSPAELTCIPESPEEASKPKRLGRRKRKPEVSVDSAEDGGSKEGSARMTRSRKRGKTSTT